jgi:hypothetical protein
MWIGFVAAVVVFGLAGAVEDYMGRQAIDDEEDEQW